MSREAGGRAASLRSGLVAAAAAAFRAGLVAALAASFAALPACGGPPRLPAPEGGSVAVAPEAALGLRRRLDGFYLRLAHRRFNSLETYNDRIMREHFRNGALFLDYYADLAQAFADAHFDKRRPQHVEVLEFLFEDPARARVQVRFVGLDDRPLRPGTVELVRVDRWEWAEGTWWIQPGKL